MGSYYDLRIGGYSVLSAKWPIEEAILSLFVEADKVNALTPPDHASRCANVHTEGEFFGYRSTAAAIADRLDVMGFTPERTRADFSAVLKNEVANELQVAEEWASREAEGELLGSLAARARERSLFLSELDFEKWAIAIRRLKNDGIRWSMDSTQVYARELDPVETLILTTDYDTEHTHLGFYCSDSRFLVRAFTMCAEPADLVVLDCTDLVIAGYFDAGEPITAWARSSITADARAVPRVN